MKALQVLNGTPSTETRLLGYRKDSEARDVGVICALREWFRASDVVVAYVCLYECLTRWSGLIFYFLFFLICVEDIMCANRDEEEHEQEHEQVEEEEEEEQSGFIRFVAFLVEGNKVSSSF